MPRGADAMTTVGSDQRRAGWRSGRSELQGRTLLWPRLLCHGCAGQGAATIHLLAVVFPGDSCWQSQENTRHEAQPEVGSRASQETAVATGAVQW